MKHSKTCVKCGGRHILRDAGYAGSRGEALALQKK